MAALKGFECLTFKTVEWHKLSSFWKSECYHNNICKLDSVATAIGLDLYMIHHHYPSQDCHLLLTNSDYRLITLSPITYRSIIGGGCQISPCNNKRGEAASWSATLKHLYQIKC